MAGGGAAFVVFAQILFDRVAAFSPHPRFDAGEIIGPIVAIANGTQLAVGGAIAFFAFARRSEYGVKTRVNRWVAYLAAVIAVVAVLDRLVLMPQILALREAIGRSGFDGDPSSPERQRFGLLHGVENLAQLVCVLSAFAGLLLERGARRTFDE